MTFKVLTLPIFHEKRCTQARFQGSIVINKGDISQWFIDGSSDAIVNPTNEMMIGDFGAAEAIHLAAGPKLQEACFNFPELKMWIRCPVGQARITQGFNLPASRVIHSVGPLYDMSTSSKALLRNAYMNSLTLAKENNIRYVALPAISCGSRGYPYKEAAMIALSTAKDFVKDFKEIHFVLFLDDVYDAWLEKAKELLRP